MLRRVRPYRALILALLAASVSGCAMFGGKDNSPAWFRQRVKELEKGKYPQLASVPATVPSHKTPAEWQAMESEVERAGATLAASPRAAAAAPEAAAAAGAFEAQARKEASAARPER
ncbi:MAG: hypothetical protein ABUS57_15275 [Pseudomonadota bacterium]